MRQQRGFVYAAALGAALLATASASKAFAEDPDGIESTSTPPAPPPLPTEGAHNDTKDTLLGTGLFLLAVSYLPAVSVAASSTMMVDQHLYVPVVGPWIDLSQRPACAPPLNCATEQTNRALLETSGILQGVGAFLTLVGLLTSDDDDVNHPAPAKSTNDAKATRIQVMPTQFGATGYGLAAFGKF